MPWLSSAAGLLPAPRAGRCRGRAPADHSSPLLFSLLMQVVPKLTLSEAVAFSFLSLSSLGPW